MNDNNILTTERTRIASINAKCDAHFMGVAGQMIPDRIAAIRANAISEGWSEDKTELELLRAKQNAEELVHIRGSRPKAPEVHSSNRDSGPEVIQAAFSISAGLVEAEKAYHPEVLRAAEKYRGIGLQEVILMQARSQGYDGRERIHSGNCREVLKAAFSTHSLGTMLSTSGNKLLLDGFNVMPQSWKAVAAVRNVKDFKEATAYRMTAGLEYEEVGPAGEIKHGTLGKESYTLQAKTYAKMLTLTRQDIINDDLGAFNDLRNRLGMGAAIKLNKVFWTAWMAASAAGTFWTTGRGNLVESSPLGEAGLGTAVKAFRSMSGPDGNTMSLDPKFLLCPADLEPTAKKWYASQEMRDTTDSTLTPTANIYYDSFKPIPVAELSNEAFTGYSATTYWLLADPQIIASASVCFLDGRQAPTIESADADFNTLGIDFRGYHDWGVQMSEYRASVKATA